MVKNELELIEEAMALHAEWYTTGTCDADRLNEILSILSESSQEEDWGEVRAMIKAEMRKDPRYKDMMAEKDVLDQNLGDRFTGRRDN